MGFVVGYEADEDIRGNPQRIRGCLVVSGGKTITKELSTSCWLVGSRQ